MFNKLKVTKKIWAWLMRPPKIGTGTLKIIAEDLRKIGLGLMATGLVGLLEVMAKFSVAGALLLFILGVLFWLVALVLHSIYERALPKE